VKVVGPLGARATTMHAVDVTDRRGAVLELAIRRFHDTGRLIDDRWYQPAHEAQVLVFLAGSAVRAPELVALDADASSCDVPALLTTRLRGVPVAPPDVPAGFIAKLVEPLVDVYELAWPPGTALPAYESYHAQGGGHPRRPPRWSAHPERWARVFELLESPAPDSARGFVHRDYHPAQILFGGAGVGVCDWLTACDGPYGIDLARMRLNLAEGWSLELAEAFRRRYRSVVGVDRVHPYWDLLDAADVVLDLPDGPADERRPAYQRFEEWVGQALAELSEHGSVA
jgi:aminoglycoside phosphotransferase (APT) family kinase protein